MAFQPAFPGDKPVSPTLPVQSEPRFCACCQEPQRCFLFRSQEALGGSGALAVALHRDTRGLMSAAPLVGPSPPESVQTQMYMASSSWGAVRAMRTLCPCKAGSARVVGGR